MLDTNRESAQSIEQAALVWAARVDRGSLNDQEEAELNAWVAQDTRRAGAFARAMAANAYLDRTAALGAHYQPARVPLLASMGRRRMLAAAGGALAASIVAGVFGLRLLPHPARLATIKGDIRRVPLAEGSAVTLNTDSAIEPLLSAELRRVNLVRGEALFDVAKDPARPFVVYAGDTRVRAVGTSFNVRLHEQGGVAVSVREGIVEVTRGAQPSLRLRRGEYALSEAGRPLAARQIPDQELERSMAWRDGRLDLTGMTLGEAAAEFARYSDQRIMIADPAVASRRVAGVYSTSDPLGFARAVALGLGLTASQEDGAVQLRAPLPGEKIS
ncbi:FecR family protein [Sphingomonas endolithica]|uniref:FecR family protein n=1 Tax=Sphingomonas endolithica TaxID=2972485 RepID=UPI0021AE551A|nr:FecR domain-containing protein [Sphingomonas sp. ZFBP2030]